MNINVQQIEKLLKSNNKFIRKADAEDVMYIKNKLFSLVKDDKEDDDSNHVFLLLNEMHSLNIVVENEDEKSVTYYYEPNNNYYRKSKLNESGWIVISR